MTRNLISIWFLIGLVVLVYGVLIFAAGVHDLLVPPAQPVVLAHLHAGIWSGAIMAILGLVYAVCFRPRKEQKKQ